MQKKTKMRYTIDQRKFIVTQYFSNNENINAVIPLFAQRFGIPAPKKESMFAMIAKWNEHGTVHDRIKGISGRKADVTEGGNVQRVRDEFMTYPNQTLSRASQTLNISASSIHRILRKGLAWKPWKTQKRHFIPQRSEVPRILHAGSLLDVVNSNPDFLGNVFFSDESHFELTPALNKQNNRHWGPVQPYNVIHRPLHPERTTVWGAVSANGSDRII